MHMENKAGGNAAVSGDVYCLSHTQPYSYHVDFPSRDVEEGEGLLSGGGLRRCWGRS